MAIGAELMYSGIGSGLLALILIVVLLILLFWDRLQLALD